MKNSFKNLCNFLSSVSLLFNTFIMKFIFVFLFFAGSLWVNAQQNAVQQKTITVTGNAELEIVPNEIDVQVNLREYTKKNGEKVTIETIKNNFLTACKSIGLTDKEISVQSYQGFDSNYWLYRKNKKQTPNMNAGISYWIQVNTAAKVESIINILDDEATENFFIAKVSHSNINEFKKQLKMEAIQAAKTKAIYLAEAINEHVGEAITITEPTETDNYPRPYYAAAMYKSSTPNTNADALAIDFKKIKLAYTVTVVFALK